MHDGPVLEICFTNRFEDACRLRDDGYEPIECAFGQHGSVMGRYNMDHHGLESHREGVAIRACRDHYAALSHDRRFVVTGSPDADAVLAIIGLAGLVPKNRLQPSFFKLVDAHDRDPIGMDLLTLPHGLELMWFNQIHGLAQNTKGFQAAVGHMVNLLTHGLDEDQKTAVEKADRGRRRAAWQGIVAAYNLNGQTVAPEAITDNAPVIRGQRAVEHPVKVAVVESAVWGFDQWYRRSPVVVSYSRRLEKVTVGCPDEETARLLFGDGGLMSAWQCLGRGWGGRPSIGGSPRGETCELTDAHKTAHALLELIRRRTLA